MADLAGLLDRLRHGERPTLARDEVDALVTWLCGAADRDRDDAEKILPTPGHDPVMLQMVFYRLDATLFNGSQLNVAVAGLDAGQPEKLRKVRFRRLAGAFHPDRYPELADWLTARSQIVLQAYNQFKHPRSKTPAIDPVPASTDARQAPSDLRPRGRPRASKKRLRGFMLRLRQRFGHDRYLAHKLVGGLAVIALLPVLNLLLAPGKGTVDSGTGGEATVDGGEAAVDGGEATVDGLRFTVDGENREKAERLAGVAGASPAGEKAGAAAEGGGNGSTGAGNGLGPHPGEPDLAKVAENGKRKTESAASSAPEITPLLAAARRAMNPGGYPKPVAALPSVDEQLAAMGLESDTERLYRRMGDEKKETVDGERLTVDGEKREEAERVAGVAGASRAGEGEESQAQTVSVFRFPFSGEQAEAAVEGGGSGVSGDSDNAMAIETGESGLATVAKSASPDESLAGQTPTTVAHAGGESAGAVSGRDRSAQEVLPAAQPDVESGESDLATIAENEKRKAESADDNRSAETRIATAETETTILESPARKPSTVNRKPSRKAPPALEPGKLALGPMASSAPGKLLAGLKDDLEQGNIMGLMSRFSRRARHGELSGLDEIAAHYRALFDRLDPRQVDLSARRIERDGEGWRVEAVMTIRGYRRGRRGQALETVLDQRIVMQLDERDRRLQIKRLEP